MAEPERRWREGSPRTLLVHCAISRGHVREIHNQQSIEGGSPRTAQTSTAHCAKPIRSQRESTLYPSIASADQPRTTTIASGLTAPGNYLARSFRSPGL